MHIRIGHSPDADDAFMFYALAEDHIDTGDIVVEHVIEEIEQLNQRALHGELEATALSIHTYALVSEQYALLPYGASMGDGYGPVVVARDRLEPGDLAGRTVAVPGRLTTAFLALQMLEPSVVPQFYPFDQIMRAVQEGEVDAGVVIHEGQITYTELELQRVVDLGEWWGGETGLPLPLGADAVRRDLDQETIREITHLLGSSIQYAFNHRTDAVRFARTYGRGMDLDQTNRFVSMYVNDWTLDYGDRGRQAVAELLNRAHRQGLVPHLPSIEFVEPSVAVG